MKKKLVQNYTFNFSSNDRKILTTFVKQAVNQLSSKSEAFSELNIFNSVLEKLQSHESSIKFTKNEKIRLVNNIKANADFLKEKSTKGWFLSRWLYKSMFKQYNNILINYFDE